MGDFQNHISIAELRQRNEASQAAAAQKPPQEQTKPAPQKG